MSEKDKFWYDEMTPFTKQQYDVLLNRSKTADIHFIAGEDIKAGQFLSVGKDGMAYRTVAKRKWTDAEIQEAKNIVYDAMVDRNHEHREITISHHEKTTGASMDIYDYEAHTKSRLCASTTCADYNTYNEHIGNMVAVCKLLGKKLPSWMQEDK